MNPLPYDPVELARTLFEQAENAMFLFQPGSQQIVAANPPAFKWTGLAREDLLQQPIASLFRPESPNDEALLQAAFSEGVACRACDALLRSQEGEDGWMRVQISIARLSAEPSALSVLVAHNRSDATRWKQAEAALLESRQRFETFMNTIPMLGFMKDSDGRLVYVNQAFTAKFARPAEHFLGKLDHELFPAEVARKLHEADLRVMAGAKAVELREQAPTPDGILREWWVVKFPFRDAQGRVFLGGVALDLTERRQLEDALRRSEERYRDLWQRNLAGGFRASLDGRILDCNDSFARLFGFHSRADMMTRSTKELYFDLGAREEFLIRLRAQRSLTNYEMQMRRADGAAIWVLENVSLVHEKGAEILEGTIIDISDRKRAEEALRASENNYRTLINHLDQGIFLKDRELRYVTVNPIFCDAVGKTEAELRGKTIHEAFPGYPLTEKSRAIEKGVFEHGQSVEVEEVLSIRGKPRTVRISRTPVKDATGAIVGVLGICWDVTEQRELEAQLRHVQKMEAIGQLAGGIAHDFNNLLTIMLGNLSYILSGTLDSQTTLDLVKNVESAGLRAAELTQKLLGFSHRAAQATVPYNLNEAIDEVIGLTRSTLPNSIEQKIAVEQHLWPVQADPTHMHQVLTNLTLNARDAMPQGGKITYQTSHFIPDAQYLASYLEARPGEYVCLRVKDTGAGIPAELRQRIFEPFFTTKEKGKGTGLGLATVFSIIKQHKGWIVCESEPGRGTAFNIFLPRCRDAVNAPAEVPNGDPRPPRETILLADDEMMIRQLTNTILSKAGYRVLLAENGEKALELFQAHEGEIALVILDAVMPRLSGRETLRELARIAPNVSVLFSSGFSTEQLALNEFPQVRGLLPKPYRAEQLVQKVVEILGQTRRAAKETT